MKFLSDILAKAGLTVDGVVTLNNTATGQTPAANDNSTKLATTAWVRTFVQPYSLPIASASILGGIKVGTGLSIDSVTGVLSAVSAGAASIKSTQTFIATAGQTVFTISGGYTAGLIDVFLNGVYLSPNQTTATNGTTVTLSDAALVGDIIDVIIASPIYQGATITTDQLPEGVVNLYYTDARSRAAISLTVTGTSGASTYNSTTGVLNVPTYTLAGLGGVVSTRTITINGVTYDLTANRSWSALPVGGTAGQLLAKVDSTDYNAQWINEAPAASYTSQLKHVVKAGVAINKGQAVYVSSADGTNMIVSKASNATEGTSSKTLGLLETTASANGFANVITEGLLSGLDTTGANAAGDPVWLGTDGNLIYGLINKPSAPAHLVFIGVVTRRNANNGEIFVKVQNGFEMGELHDYVQNGVQDNYVISYELSTSLYKPKSIATLLGYTPANAARSLTINGTSYDLTADRTWTLTTSNIAEGTNLYYTDTRVGTYLTANSYATQSYVSTQINNLVSGAPGLLDTLDELAAALGDDPNFATTVSTALSNRLRIDIGTQGLTSTQQGYGRTNLGLGSLAVLSSVGNAQITDVAWSKVTGTPTSISGYGITDSLVYTTSTYSNPSWITSLAYSKITGVPAFLTSYTETDTLQSVTTRGSSTSTTLSTNGGKLVFRDDSIENSITALDSAAIVINYLGYNTTNSYFRDVHIFNGKSGTVAFFDGSTGHIGFGNAAPSYRLDIVGSIRLTGALVLDDTTSNTIQHRAGTDVNTLVTVGHGGFDHGGYLRLNGADVATQSYVTSRGYITGYTETDPFRVTSVAVTGTSTKTITLTRADNSTVSTTWTDIDTDTNTFASSLGFSGGTLTLTNNNSSTVTVSLDGRYYLASNPSGYISGNQNITLSGEVTGSGATSIVTTIANNAITSAKINNGAVTAAKLATFGAGEGITWAANTDGASIIFESTSDGASGGRALSNLLIALTDNGDEGLKVTTTGAELLYVNINQFQYKGSNVWTAASLTNLNQLTNGPGYITGYTETDTLSTVTGRGASTSSAVTFNAGITVNGTAYYTFSKPSTASYQTVALFGSDSGGIFITTDSGIISRGTYFASGWIARSANGALIDFADTEGGINIQGFTGATVGGSPTFENLLKATKSTFTWKGNNIWHAGNLTNLNQLSNGPGYITSYTETDTLASVTGRGATTSTPITVTASEGREVAVYMASSYTTDDLVSGHEYGWYNDHWRLGMTRSGGAAGADFVIQWNAARRLSLTNGGNLTATGVITANRFISNATDVGGEWYFFRGNSSVSNALTMYTYSDNVYTNVYKSYHIRANNTGGSGGYIHLHGGSIMLGTANAPSLHSSTVGVVIQGPSSSRGILEIWDGASGKSVFQNVGGTTYIGQLDKGSGSGITYLLVNGNGTSADVALTLNANTSAAFNSTVTATAFLKTGGTSSQFLMADGSVSTNPGWVTGGPYLPLTSSGTQNLRFDTASTEHITFQNQSSGGLIQLGFQQTDSDGLHHRAYIKSYKSAAGNYSGVIEIIARSVGGGTTVDVLKLEAGQAPKWSGNVMLHAANYSSYNSFSTLSASGFLSATGGSKLVVQNSQSGGTDRGIFMWNSSDANWGIYMATGGATSMGGGTTCNALDGSSSHAIRFRIYSGTSNSFIWENHSESCLMSLGADTAGNGLFVKRRIRNSGGYTLSGDFGFYTSYTSDGLWGGTATPNSIGTTSNGGRLVLGYQDNGSGLYSPAYGFEVRSTDGRPVANQVVRALVMKDVDKNTYPFIVYNNGAIYSAENIQASKFLVNGDSWIVFNNEEGAWGIKTRTASSTSKLGSALKNMFYCGGGANEGFVITGVGTGDPSFEITNGGAAFIKDRLLINTGTHWNNEKLGVQISNGNNLTNVPSLVRLTNYTSGGITKMTFTDSSIIDGIFCMTPISNGSYWSLGFAGYTEQGLKVYQNGNVVAAGDVTAYSDERVKENIVTVDNALEKTLALRGVYYNRTDTDDKRKKIGVIAQEVEIIAPELVTRMEDDMLNVSYGNMAGLFIEAIKEQQTQIESQKSEIEELKDLVKQLINR